MRALLILIAACFATNAAAQGGQPGVPNPEAAQALGTTPVREPTAADVADIQVNQIYIFGDDACPPSTDPDTINVCARLPASDRFRIPENLRNNPDAPENQSWANRAIELSYAGRSGIGSCSPSGPGGFTGCNLQLINQAVAERRGRPEVNWARLIEEARQERLAGINRQSAEAELNAGGNRRVQELVVEEGQLCPPSTELVILVCRTASGRPVATQPAGEPQIPVAGRVQPALPQQPRQPQP
jgi:hypothetical protein